MRHRIIDTFTGPFVLMQDENGGLATSWIHTKLEATLASSRQDARLLPDLARRLSQFFDGRAVDFTDVPLPAGSRFYQGCWKACRRIPRGQTRGYGELARAAGGDAAAARAAGQAMRHNPLPIVIPCHRVISANGGLHGFGGSCDGSSPELAIKYALLRMEGAAAASKPGLRSKARTLDSLFAGIV